MKKLILKLKNNELIKVSWKNSIQVGVQFIAGLIKIKIASVWLGPSGMALLSQFTNFTQLTGNIASGGIANGVTKLAKHGHSKKQLGIIISSSLIITVISSLTITLFLFLFADLLSEKILHDSSFTSVIKYTGFFLFFSALTNFSLALLKGLKNYKDFIRTNMLIVISSISFLIPAIYFWGIKGALWAILLTFLTTGIYCIKFLDVKYTKPVFSTTIGKLLLGFSTMLIVTSIITPLSQIFVRNIIIENCSLIEAGWWDGVKRVSVNYLSIATATISLYMLPTASSLTNYIDIKKEIKNYFILVIPMITIASGTIYLSRYWIINILFSTEFKPMESLFLYQCVGDVFKMMSWFFSVLIIMQEKVRIFIAIELTMGIVILSSAYIIIPWMGITGSTLSYLINNIIYFSLTSTLFYHSIMKKSHRS